jgi:hypothetical protein
MVARNPSIDRYRGDSFDSGVTDGTSLSMVSRVDQKTHLGDSGVVCEADKGDPIVR